jgi:type IV secretion system protein TrbL
MMNNFGVVDNFLILFTTYIDSGFGLLSTEVRFLSSTLIAIDLTIAALFWAWSEGGPDEVMKAFIKKILYVGAFSFIITNFRDLSVIIYDSFARLGIVASGSSLSPEDLLLPGKVAATGFDAIVPVMAFMKTMVGFPDIFYNIHNFVIALVVVLIILFSFFIASIQVLIAIIEFKLTALCGFVLIPFSLWNKSTFLAEKVLGNIMSSGIKVMVLAVVIGIGSTVFNNFITAFGGNPPTIQSSLALALGAMTFLALSIFGPGIASGIVSGGPQLGAGAAIGTAAGLAGAGMAAMGAGRLAGKGVGGAVSAASSVAGAASSAARLGIAAAGPGATLGKAMSGALGGMASAAGGAAKSAISSGAQSVGTKLSSTFGAGQRAGVSATGGTIVGAAPAAGSSTQATKPTWARDMQRRQAMQSGVHAATAAVSHGNTSTSSSGPSLDPNAS